MSTPLDSLLSRPGLIWRPGERRAPVTTGLPTGFAPLDSALRESGWPRSALVELLAGRPGAGELRLLLPALAALAERGLYPALDRPAVLAVRAGVGAAWSGPGAPGRGAPGQSPGMAVGGRAVVALGRGRPYSSYLKLVVFWKLRSIYSQKLRKVIRPFKYLRKAPLKEAILIRKSIKIFSIPLKAVNTKLGSAATTLRK